MAQPMQVLRHQEISPEAIQHANAHQLGGVQSEYKVRMGKWQIRYIITFAIVTLVFALVSVGMASGNGDSATSLIVFLPITLVFLGLAIFFGLQPAIYRSRRVCICNYGLLYVRGSRVDAFRWDQITAFFIQVVNMYYYGIRTGTRHRYTVRYNDGRKIVFSDLFADVEEIGNAIDYELIRVQLPMAIAAFESGQTLAFGNLQVNRQGIAKSQQQWLAWQELKDVYVSRGILGIKKSGQMLNWFTIRVARLPNMNIFLALVEHARKQQMPYPVYPNR